MKNLIENTEFALIESDGVPFGYTRIDGKLLGNFPDKESAESFFVENIQDNINPDKFYLLCGPDGTEVLFGTLAE